jgi:hypothetical protein
MLVVHTPRPTPRTAYALHAVFDSILGVPWRLEPYPAAFAACPGPKLRYAEEPLQNCDAAWTKAEGLLAERGIRKTISPPHPTWGIPAQFVTGGPGENALEADVFSAAFWWLSRMEEHNTFEPDAHGRFPAGASWAAQNGCLQRPMVDLAAAAWWENLRQRYPELPPPRNGTSLRPTYDIDYAWSYLHKGWARNLGGAARDLLAGQWSALGERAAVCTGFAPDPFYTFDGLEALHAETGLRPTFFWLVGDRGPHDKNISHQKTAMRRLIRQVAERHDIGLHPSHRSFDRPELLAVEKKRLEDIAGRPVLRSRQHYLRLRFPDTPRLLLENGIREDWSLGFAERPGFRAGTARPFPWYDLSKESATDLLLVPFQSMDVTYRTYLGLDPEAAELEQARLLDALGPLGGELVSIWHNNSFSEKEPWIGWRQVYRQWLRHFSAR